MNAVLTPRWCSLCDMVVPVEREPHVSPRCLTPHYADTRSAAIEATLQGIIDLARAGDWEGPELPDQIAAAIAHGEVCLRMPR